MKNKQALKSLLSRPLALNKELAFPVLAGYAAALETGTEASAEAAKAAVAPGYYCVEHGEDDKVVIGAAVRGATMFNEAPPNSVAYIPVRGVMMRDSGWMWGYGYVTGTRELEDVLRAAEAATNISAIVIQLSSPGGEAYGNESLLNLIKSIKTPTVVHFDGMASAAVYSFIGANEIYAVERSSYFGSIGTMATIWNDTKMMEEFGIEVRDIYAPQSELKNEDWRKAMEGDDTVYEAELGKLAGHFISAVQKARPSIKDDKRIYKGAIYTAEEAFKMGAIDGIKSLDFVLERAAFLGRQAARGKGINNSETQSNMTQVKMSAKELTAWQKFKSAFGLVGDDEEQQEEQASSGKTVEIMATQLEAVMAEKATLAQQLEAVTAEKAGLAAELETANAAKGEAEQQLEALTTAVGAALATAKVVEGAEPFADVDALVEAYNGVVAHNIELGGNGAAPALPVDNKETSEAKQEPKKNQTIDERYAEVQRGIAARKKAEAEAKAEAKN